MTDTNPDRSYPQKQIGAVVLAAGLGSRMGQPKPLLAWLNDETILDHILRQLKNAGVNQIVVVTGKSADVVKQIAEKHNAQAIHNPDFANGEMLSSIKVGLATLAIPIQGMMLTLGDQPTIKAAIVEQIINRYRADSSKIVIPSYQMRRGHPIVIDRVLWAEILALPEDGALRLVINRHANEIAYVNAEDDSILRDVDTPEQYDQERRRVGLPPI